jgi:hypothetical protein
MKRQNIHSGFGIILAVGSAWGLVEFGAGLGLQKCATLMTGAILTGLSFFWLSLIWTVSKRLVPVLMIMAIAMAFKWLDAMLLHVSWNHGSVLNPMFAFFTAMAGFIILIAQFKKGFLKSLINRILIGGGAAIIATAMFPLVKFATGIPACTYAATNIPLAIYTAPVAILIAIITVPLGYKAAIWLNDEARKGDPVRPATLISRLWSPALFVASVIIIIAVRMI